MTITFAQSSVTSFPTRVSNTRAVRAWLDQWHKEHLLPFSADLRARIAWDGHWVHEKSGEQLESNLMYWGWDRVIRKMIVETILRERRKVSGFFENSEATGLLTIGKAKDESMPSCEAILGVTLVLFWGYYNLPGAFFLLFAFWILGMMLVGHKEEERAREEGNAMTVALKLR
jgi:hypothetical protein